MVLWRSTATGRVAPLLRVLLLLAPLVTGAPTHLLATLGHHDEPLNSEEYLFKLVFSAGLVLVGGLMSGLTLGLMGLDLVNLRVLSTSGSEAEQKDAATVLGLLETGRHWILVTLLLSNVVVNESLPIFLDSILGGGVAAVVLSTCLIVIFGEVIPQAVCARHGLHIGAKFAPFVLCLMYAEFPVAYPIAKLLDWLLGEAHGTVYKKAELKTFVGLHRHIGEETLNEDEVTIISAVLELSDKPVSEIMTPIEDTYTLSSSTLLDQSKVDEILALGHSRIPIHAPLNPDNFVGMLIVKKLISYDPAQAEPISSFPLSVLPETGPDSTCLDALNYFQQGRSHILLVSRTPGKEGGAIGVVSLEDVIEEMIGEEIIDETDVYVDIHHKIKVVRGPAKRVAAEKALAPLIQGVIERRRTHRSEMDYGTMEYGTGANTPAIDTPPAPIQASMLPKAFGKIKVRGGVPERRSGFINRIASGGNASGANTPSMLFGSPSKGGEGAGAMTRDSSVDTREGRSRSRGRERETDEEPGEGSSLLRKDTL